MRVFQKAYPNYKIRLMQLIAEHNKVFAWFSVWEQNKLIINSFVLLTVEHRKITKAVKLVKMYPSLK